MGTPQNAAHSLLLQWVRKPMYLTTGVFLVAFGWRAMAHERFAPQLLLYYSISAQHAPTPTRSTLPKPLPMGLCTWQTPFSVGHLQDFPGQQTSMASVGGWGCHVACLLCPSVPCLPSRHLTGKGTICLPFLQTPQVCWLLPPHLASLGGRGQARRGGEPSRVFH